MKKSPSKYLLVFYDSETVQIKNPNTEDKNKLVTEHKVNLIVAQHVCNICSNLITDNSNVDCCGLSESGYENVQVFLAENETVNIVGQFLKYLSVLQINMNCKVVVIAHNNGGFDIHFLLNEMFKDEKPLSVVTNGTKIIKLDFGTNITFLDSLNFLPFALSKFPKIFGLNDISKGYYPYLFNSFENINYKGKYPDVEYFGVSNMKSDDKQKFLGWYDSVKNSIFDNRKELIKYCIADVELLKQGCLNFLNNFLKENSINIFLESVTIASATMIVYRKNFMPEKCLGLAPKQGYRNKMNQSRIAFMWLELQNEIYDKEIVFSGYPSERKIPDLGFHVDGFIEKDGIVFEFWGCFWHGHTCFRNRKQIIQNSTETMSERYESTLARIDKIKRKYKLVDVWECEFQEMLKKDKCLEQRLSLIVDNSDYQTCLEPRDALYGGRTEVFKTYYKVQNPCEKIKYFDFTSLYPFVMKTGKYPVGHPEIFIKGYNLPEDVSSIITENEGFIKCRILPPQKLYLPILPYRYKNKLFFPLCKACLENSQHMNCNHMDEKERLLDGTWVLAEIRLALEYGYKIIETFEIHKYESKVGIFTPFVDNFLKIKQESSGWPVDCTNEVQKDQYIDDYFKNEGILLERSKISLNPGLRMVAKQILNSLWGKFVMRTDRHNVTFVKTNAELHNLIADELIQISSLIMLDDCIVAAWKYTDKRAEYDPSFLNIPIGTYTTALARITLYRLMAKINESLLYVDTDSAIFVDNGSLNDITCGNYLGELTNEIECGYNIHEFVSTGAKSYALKIVNEKNADDVKYTVKCKGFTINSSNEDKINFASFKKMVCNFNDDSDDDEDTDSAVVKISNFKIKRARLGKIVSCYEQKRFKFTLDKRRIVNEYDTLPFGF